MVDHEVENTLREIRDRVRAAAPPPTTTMTTSAAGAVAAPAEVAARGRGAAFEALARMEANLATTERAWPRLPPLLSYRRGAAARLELWLKRLVKRALHWFTWEQVNFNSAAHHALRDALAALSTHEQLLAASRAETDALRRRAEESAAEAEAARARLAAQADSLSAELRAELRAARGELQTTRAELQAVRSGLPAELRAQLGAEFRAELAAESGAVRAELRERAEHLAEEQRVCFRQLSIEATEAAVTHDRARRHVEARLEELEKAVNLKS